MDSQPGDALISRLAAEVVALGDDFRCPVFLDLTACLQLVGNLQLALRHPNNTGASAETARRLIDGIIDALRQSGYTAHAELAAMGDEPAEVTS